MEAATRPRHHKSHRRLLGLREARENAALTVRELGALSGVHYVSITELEKGVRGARPGTVRKLANALGVTPKMLYEAPKEVDEK